MTTTLPITTLAQNAPPSALPGMLLALGVLAVGLSVWWSLRKKLKRGFRQARESSAEKIHRVRSTFNHRDRERIETYMADAEELTRRLAAILDNKAERVEALIDRAEQRLAQLDARANADHHSPTITTARVAPPRTDRRTEPDRSTAPDAIRYEPADPVAVDVYRLADEGKTPLEIAKALDEHTGKIELILALRD